MATPLMKVYDAFLARITADEWTLEEEFAMVERDWRQLLDIAILKDFFVPVNIFIGIFLKKSIIFKQL